jgi:glyoxylase-like metal-dependent hydrolase (beta-lactamase superfamily II)
VSAILVRANNPSPMTLDGTNTWVLVGASGSPAIVVDPGPDDAAHQRAILEAAESAGSQAIALVLLTHWHPDHAEGAKAFASVAQAPLRAVTRELCVGARPLVDGERLSVADIAVDVVVTPGHTADSACFVLEADRALLTGDTVLGAGSTLVAYPDGRLGDYLKTLSKLRSLIDERQLVAVLPGHGPARDDPAALIDEYLEHRRQRLDRVRAAIAGGADDVQAVLDAVYGGVDEKLRDAARWTLLAQLDYLRELGEPTPVI